MLMLRVAMIGVDLETIVSKLNDGANWGYRSFEFLENLQNRYFIIKLRIIAKSLQKVRPGTML